MGKTTMEEALLHGEVGELVPIVEPTIETQMIEALKASAAEMCISVFWGAKHPCDEDTGGRELCWNARCTRSKLARKAATCRS